MNTAEKHLIIGAGFVGLGMAKALKQEGIAFDLAEADDAIGGNWYHGVYPHVHIISSKKTTQYTDFPMPESYPDFPSAGQVLDYLRNFAEHFNLAGDIQFNKTVADARPTVDEKWQVTFADGEQRIYKGILVCNGHHWKPRHPEYPGTFTGEYLHSKEYKSEKELKGKKVLVIGGGNSACDIAVDGVRVAAESHISLRRGYWFLPKSMLGIPSVEFIKPWLPVWMQRMLIKLLLRIVVGRYENYGLQKPDHRIFDHHPTINSLLLYYLKHGVIKPHPDIKCYDGNSVEFVDGSREGFDLIVAATGYYVSFPFLADGLVEVKNAIPQLPQGIVHPKHKGLYIIGWNQTRYGAGPLITAGGPAIAAILKAQDKMKRPVGAIMQKMGVKPPVTHLIDPMEAISRAKLIARIAKYLPIAEKFLFRNKPYVPATIEQYAMKRREEVYY